MHGVYERLIRWAFSWPALPHVRAALARLRPRRSTAEGTRDKSSRAACAWCHAHAARRGGLAIGFLQLRRGPWPCRPLVGSEFVPQTDQSFTQLQLTLAGGHPAWSAPTDKVLAGRGRWCLAAARKSRRCQTCGRQRRLASRNQAWLNIALVKPRSERQRSQKQVEDGDPRRRSPRSPALERVRWVSTGRST
jgi:hypothetical protein